MSKIYCRPLHNNELAYSFLFNVLDLEHEAAANATQDVVKAEKLLLDMEGEPTFYNSANRHPSHISDESRVILRRKIFDELKDLNRLADDEDIRLGDGGARPHAGVGYEKVATILTGPPASGKSTIANKIAEGTNSYVVDSDYAKRKLPEFSHEFGASIVHDESSFVTFGPKNSDISAENCLYEFCIVEGSNMVIPKIGSNESSLRKLRDGLVSQGYSVHLVSIFLDRQEACRRALQRYLSTGRYVSLSLIFDGYGNDPMLAYFRTKNDAEWASVAEVSTIKLRDSGPEVVDFMGNSPISYL